MGSFFDRIKNTNKRIDDEEERKNNRGKQNQRIWFEFTPGDHVIRLTQNYLPVRSHWIAPSKFSKIELFNASLFSKENRVLPNSVTCVNFDSETELERIDPETKKPSRECTICKIHRAACDLLYGDKKASLSPEDKEYLNNIAKATAPNERYFFTCIDRDNPYIDGEKTKKGLKIIEFPKALLQLLFAKERKFNNLDFADPAKGMDLIISKRMDGNKYAYSLDVVMDGMTAQMSPLTEEELNYPAPDLASYFKDPNQDDLLSNLNDDYRDFLADSLRVEQPKPSGKSAGKAASEDDLDSIPF